MALAVVHGAVYAKRAAWGERIECVTEPGRFWTVIGIYSRHCRWRRSITSSQLPAVLPGATRRAQAAPRDGVRQPAAVAS
ncbi:MAG: hypothetical protein U5L03_13905 [Burkholderiaceae bacterium]|nr:hypothetical protein [Burkholderiaceae bacterium]